MTIFKTERKALLDRNPHLKAYQRKKLLFFCAKFLLFEAAVISLTIYLASYTESAVVLGAFFAIVLPWWVLKPQRVFGKTGVGEIKEIVRVSKRVTREKGLAVFYTDMHYRTFIICRMINDKGREVEFEFPEQCEPVFHAGDKIIKLSAIKYPIILTDHSWCMCPFCGNVFPKENDHCIQCNAEPINITCSKK